MILYNQKEKTKQKKENKKMTTEEIKKEIERLEYCLFIEEMADFMDWDAYHRIKDKIYALKDELKAKEGN